MVFFCNIKIMDPLIQKNAQFPGSTAFFRETVPDHPFSFTTDHLITYRIS